MRIGWVITAAVPLLASSAWGQTPAPKRAAAGHTAVAPAPAPKPPNAKKLLASAAAKRQAGDCEGALADYQQSDAMAPSPVTVEGIAFCHDKLGHFDDALTWYTGFLKNPPLALQLEANAAQARVDAIKAMPGHLHIESTPSNAMVSVDGREQLTHTPLDVDLAPGKHQLHMTAAGHDPIDKDVEVASRAKQALAFELPLTPPPPPPPVVAVAPAPPPPPPPVHHSIVPAIVTGSLAVVAAGIGVGFGVAALNDHSSFNQTPTTALANSGENNALAADMGFGVAITLGVTSIVLFTTRNESAASVTPVSTPPAKTSAVSPTSFTATPFVSSHGGGAAALLRF